MPAAQAKWFLLVSDLLRVGFSLQRAVDFTITTMTKEAPVLEKIKGQLTTGKTFAASLAPYIKADLYYQLFLAEQHGDLPQVLAEIGQIMTTRRKQVKKLQQILQYPLLLLGLLGLMTVGLATFVFPQLAEWQMGGDLGRWQRVLVFLKPALGIAAAIVFLALIIRFLKWRCLPKLVQVKKLCQLPLVGECYRRYYAYYITSTLGILLCAGMSLKEILLVTDSFTADTIFFQLGRATQEQVVNGEQLGRFIKHEIYLPDELAIFINKGATLEELGSDLTAFSKIQFNHLLARLEQLFSLVQPIIFLVIAVIIVGLYLSILLPIYRSLQGVY